MTAILFLEESTLRWILIGFEFVIGATLFLLSKSQPFPKPPARWGIVLMSFAALFAIGQSAPNPVTSSGHMMFSAFFGAVGIHFGIRNMITHRSEVLVAPLSGFLFCVGMGGLMAQTWPELSVSEQWAGFFALTILGGFQTWLVFRGLLIGRLALAWSQAGMIALQRGQLHGTHGAIECFEKGWDADEEHLNPMAYLALHRIHLVLGNEEEAEEWLDSLVDVGGEKACASEWVQAIHEALIAIDASASDKLPSIEEE